MKISIEEPDPLGPLPAQAESALTAYGHECMEAESRLKNAWLALPDDVWRETRLCSLRWISNGSGFSALLKRIISEIDYDRENCS